jgi:hypothetical protein
LKEKDQWDDPEQDYSARYGKTAMKEQKAGKKFKRKERRNWSLFVSTAVKQG